MRAAVTQLSASRRTVHFRCMLVVDHIDQAAPRAPGRWTTARPRKGTTRRQGRLGSCLPRRGEYDCTMVYRFVCRRRRITAGVGLWVSREMSRPAMGVWWGGEACAAPQPAAGRREQAVPSALVRAAGAGRAENEEARRPLDGHPTVYGPSVESLKSVENSI